MMHHTRHPRVSRVVAGIASIGALALLAGFAAGCAATPTPDQTDTATAAPQPIRPAAPKGELSENLRTELQGVIDTTMTEYGVPGAAVGVWIPGKGSWTSHTGHSDIDADAPIGADMTWPLRSVTKSYTVTLILQLVDEGTVSLDDTIDEYVDGITDGDRITIRELADMSSGNADYTTTEGFGEAYGADESRIFSLAELNDYLVGEPAEFAPGELKVYTNANTNLLGAVVEKATGQDFAQALEERLLEPLGQTGTRYLLDASAWNDHPLGYAVENGVQTVQNDNLSIYGAAGSMVSTLEDALVWAEVLGSGALLGPATQTERQRGAPLDAGPPYDIYALGIGGTNGWWGHNGEGLGFTAAVFHHPETGASIVVFMNKSNVVPKAHPADQAFRRIAAALGSGS
ncbi:serine hydrolase [Microbacterium sp.]|uniref:serine hydrolase domain-containing protein n=1 Tax=Microbacterium sp. TaxID=51671 RepID=UPI002734FBA7|nr:serine hydrolase domain-containing protein [Microbacterium sp.]MDP3952086.1 serine hydrolase domain-containing protein [Microbacterium sp.]